jgi:hypothetical protein
MFIHFQLRNMSSRGRNVDQFGLTDDEDDLSKPSTAATSSCPPSDASLGLCEETSTEDAPDSSAQQDLKDKEEQVSAKVMMSLKTCISPAE